MPDGSRSDGEQGFCPSCRRSIGPEQTCPFCDADAPPALRFRVLRRMALSLGGVGLCFLYLMALRRETPDIRIGGITPRMNFASVRVSGRVPREPYLSRRDGQVQYLSFTVDDGTGSLRVSASGELARALVAGRLLPTRGSTVQVAGSLRVGGDERLRLYLQAREQLTILTPAPKPPAERRAAKGEERE
jgi:hypothetical protein